MNNDNPTEVIIVSAVIITGSTVLRNVHNKKFHFSTIVFGFLLAMALLVIAVPSPRFARVLAYLGMVGAFVVNGPDVFNLVNSIAKPDHVSSGKGNYK